MSKPVKSEAGTCAGNPKHLLGVPPVAAPDDLIAGRPSLNSDSGGVRSRPRRGGGVRVAERWVNVATGASPWNRDQYHETESPGGAIEGVCL